MNNEENISMEGFYHKFSIKSKNYVKNKFLQEFNYKHDNSFYPVVKRNLYELTLYQVAYFSKLMQCENIAEFVNKCHTHKELKTIDIETSSPFEIISFKPVTAKGLFDSLEKHERLHIKNSFMLDFDMVEKAFYDVIKRNLYMTLFGQTMYLSKILKYQNIETFIEDCSSFEPKPRKSRKNIYKKTG